MPWTVRGSRVGLRIEPVMLHGRGHSTIRPLAGDLYNSALVRLRDVPCDWWIRPVSWGLKLMDVSSLVEGVQLRDLVREHPDRPSATISYNEGRVVVEAVMPDDTMPEIRDLLKVVLRDPSLSYELWLDFIGFPVEGANVKEPTVAKFMKGLAYPSANVGFSILCEGEQ